MSGSKVVTTVTIFDILTPLVAPVLPLFMYYTGKAAYYSGKAIVNGTVAAGEMVAEGIERFEEYQRQQAELRQQKLAQARQEACSLLQENVSKAIWLCQQVVTNPFMNDDWLAQASKRIQDVAAKCSPDLELEKALELSQKLEKEVNSIKARMTSAQRCQRERESLLEQLEFTRQTIKSQRDVPSAPELAALAEYQRRIKSAKLETFPAIKAEYSHWATQLLNKLKFAQTEAKLKCAVNALWASLPIGTELAQQYDSAEYAELKRIESFILTSNAPATSKEAELVRFQKTFVKHKTTVEIKLEQEAKLEAERIKFRKIFEPKLNELSMRLAMTDKEIVNRWEKNKLANLTQQLEAFKTNLAQGQFNTMESDLAVWNESFDNMLTDAACKQQAEDRRLYIIEAMKLELPKLGFDIQSLASQADASSNTVIKVVPHTQKAGKRQRITISVPQNANEPINYKFDGYDLKHNRIEGRPVVENDAGKQTVMDIAAALKPYGISTSEPDWSGNPDKLQKNADSLPGGNNPAEELERSQTAKQNRALDLD